jgi:hypothetical protein
MATERQMRVTFLGPLRRPAGVAQKDVISVPSEGTIEDVLRQLGYQGSERKQLQLLLDGQPAHLADVLGEAQELAIFLPLGGG